ncbi:flagellar protein FliT [Planococcus shixiaomingii]|uniref:flagellar protein FliT n=1 Tax=Planococcus shixiaomingii TaxID=3058393 RepID=UPI0026315641|nr:flagellar protein FliT [Planococcus sp. N022]WKA53929.1 flagellar protein FliT [Planococcus sp. N022]
MNGYQHELSELLALTEEVFGQAQTIRSNMNENEEDSLEEIPALFERRGQAIERLDAFIQTKAFQWSEQDQKIIKQLQEIEHKLQPLINNLYESFSQQMKRISQTKQVSKKYIGAYQTTATDGSFIDKRN